MVALRAPPWFTTAAVLFLASPTAHAEWEWTSRQLKSIAKLERQVAKEGERHRLQSLHWLVETEVSPRFTAELAFFMDLLSSSLSQVIQGQPRTKKKPTIVVFRSKSRYSALFDDGSRGNYRYEYDAGGKFTEFHVYSYVAKDSETRFAEFYHPILMHEGTHILLRRLFGRTECPLWFDEGVATFFQFWDLRATPKNNLRNRYSRSDFRADLRESFKKNPLTLEQLFAVKEWNPDDFGPRAKKHYAYAESFVDFLFSTKRGRSFFKKIFRRLAGGQEPMSAKEARTIERYWQAHIHRVLGRHE